MASHSMPPAAADSERIKARVSSEIHSSVPASKLSEREKIALACRYLADHGHARTLAGQISVRAADDSFWTTSFATGFADAAVSTQVRINADLEVLEGAGIANPATRFHMWIYTNRPDVHSIVHTHPPYASALAMSGQPLIVSHMDMMMFHDDIARLAEWPGVPIANEEGRLISGALGTKNSILLANHGILTVGDTVEKAVYLAVSLEHAAEQQYLCTSSGHPPRPVAEHLATEAKRFVTAPKFIQATFDYWCRQAGRKHPDALL